MNPNEALIAVENYTVTPLTPGAKTVFFTVIEFDTTGDVLFVDIICSEMTDGSSYEVVVGPNVQDVAFNPIDPAVDTAGFIGSGIAPTLLRVEAISLNRADVIFSERMRDNESIRDPLNYIWDNGLVTMSVLDVVEDTVKLATSDQEAGLLYALTVG